MLLATATVFTTIVALAVRPTARGLKLVRALHGVHNGSVGDYVTWLLSGVATITAVAVVLH